MLRGFELKSGRAPAVGRARSGRGRRRPNHRIIVPSLLPLLVALAASPALAAGPVLPNGASVVAGSASIGAASGGALSINQSSSRAIIDWQGFSVGSGGSVQFNNGSGATLNRVTGSGVSSIDGLLSATGSVYLVNPNGVIIGKGGVVNVGGTFAASTLNVADSQFLAGGSLTFTGPSTASVVNLGKVGALGGDVALIAATVSNSGSISAPNGDVGLIAGQSVLVRDQGLNNGRFTVLVGGPATSSTNNGAIAAAEAELRANGGNVYALAGNTAGVIRATGVAAGGGKVFLIAEGGTTTANGEIDATNADGSGGHVETSGATVDFNGLIVKAGDWLIDPADLTVDATAAATISANLATTSVTLQTTVSGASGPGNINTAGVGDINITSAISWSSTRTLTLDAYQSVNITAPVTVSGAGHVVLKTNDGGSGGNDTFGLGPNGFSGSLSFTGTPGGGQGLTINGHVYTLIYKLADGSDTGPDNGGDDIAGMDPIPGATFYQALAVNLNGTGVTFTSALVGANGNYYVGVFDGLGHTITNLTINDPSGSNVGLFGSPIATLQNIGLVGGSVIGNSFVGGLAGSNIEGRIIQDYSSVAVSGTVQTGGLVGRNTGVVTQSYATGNVTCVGSACFATGGLVGDNDDIISQSFATGAVTGLQDVGGLAGKNDGAIPGGLAAQISTSYATGAVVAGSSPNQGQLAGGLVGENDGSIYASYATGAVSGFQDVGGLVGENAGGLTQAYAFGSVAGSQEAGGLVGINSGSISQAYSTGVVTGTSAVGGLIGFVSGGSVASSYWGMQTSGRTTSAGGTGLTTAALQGVLPSGFTSSVWGTGSGLYPYLKAFYASTPEAVSGFSYGASGAASSAGTQVSVIANGAAFGSALTGANGYYYVLAPGGTITTGQSLLAYTTDGAALAAATGVAGQGGLNLNAQYLTVSTAATALSAAPGFTVAQTAALAADGGNLTAAAAINGATGLGLTATGSSFTIDQAVNSSTGLLIRTTAFGAPITVAQSVNLNGSAGLELLAASSIAINAPITVAGTGKVVLANTLYSYVGGYGFGLSSSGFAGSLSFTGTPGGGQGLTINGQAYTLLYALADGADTGPDSGTDDIAGIDHAGDSGHYALAVNLTGTGTTFTGALAGAGANTFTGALEGLGHTITGLTISAPSATGVGLLGASSGSVQNLGLAGGSISGQTDVGALAGSNLGRIVQDYSTATVAGATDVGGLIGANAGQVNQSFGAGNVSGNAAGGLVGENKALGAITASFASGAVSGSVETGGLVGLNDAKGSSAAAGSIATSYATGTVSGAYVSGGLVGLNAGTISQSFAKGAVTGLPNSLYDGGLTGVNGGTISQAYATGAVSGGKYVGGLTGSNGGAVIQTYATGAVTGTSMVGGLIGATSSYYVLSSYWDTQTSGRSTSSGGTGLTTTALQGALPSGFNSTAWATGAGSFPHLTAVPVTAPQAVRATPLGASASRP